MRGRDQRLSEFQESAVSKIVLSDGPHGPLFRSIFPLLWFSCGRRFPVGRRKNSRTPLFGVFLHFTRNVAPRRLPFQGIEVGFSHFDSFPLAGATAVVGGSWSSVHHLMLWQRGPASVLMSDSQAVRGLWRVRVARPARFVGQEGPQMLGFELL